MRVLAMFHAYVPTHGAGAEGMAHGMLRHLVRQGHEVDVVLSKVDPTVPEDYTFEGVRVHRYRGKTQVPEMLSTSNQAHVIVCHLENTPRAAILGKMFSVPVVQLLHNDRPETMNSTIRYEFALLVANTEWMEREYTEFWTESGIAQRARLIRIRPPVDPGEYALPLRTKPGKSVALLNLTVPKGAHTFYALAERLPQYQFLGVKGAYGIQTVRDDLPNVTIVDNVPSDQVTQRVYAQSRVVLMPSDYESYGRVAAEASCAGVPVIAHPTEGLREALGPAGLFHDRDDIDAWEHEVRRLFTPRGWSVSSAAAIEWSRQLDPSAELDLWHDAIREVASVSHSTRHHH
ncbi:MAG TPA: glycosyltransferase family 4 protein [Pedococcus sp.]|nr:glycosyltransferase family 4 protein [Pedococcus sp.]